MDWCMGQRAIAQTMCFVSKRYGEKAHGPQGQGKNE
jgi:hypothetical protein